MLLVDKDGIKIYSDDVEEIIERECQRLKIEDLTKEGQRRFKAILQIVGLELFPGTVTRDLYGIRNNKGQPLNNYCNDDIYINLCEYYIYLCNIYNKLVSFEGYAYLCNVDYMTVCRWEDAEPNSAHRRIWERLYKKRQEVLSDACFDTSGPVGKLGVANHEYKWAQPQIIKEQRINILAADALPVLSAIGAQNAIAINDNKAENSKK